MSYRIRLNNCKIDNEQLSGDGGREGLESEEFQERLLLSHNEGRRCLEWVKVAEKAFSKCEGVKKMGGGVER